MTFDLRDYMSKDLLSEGIETTKSSKMKVSELKSFIKESVLSEMQGDSEKKLPESLDSLVGELRGYRRDGGKKMQEVGEEDIELDIDSELGGGSEEIDLGIEDPAMDAAPPAPDTKTAYQALGDNLRTAYNSAVELDDQKLAQQIGNIITFFTRQHVVTHDNQ